MAHRQAVLNRWLHRLDGQSTARQAAALARLAATASPSRIGALEALGRGAAGTTKRLAMMAMNRAAGRPFDAPLRQPRRQGGVEVNELGYADRLVRQPDVEAWCRRLREFRRSQRPGERPSLDRKRA
jgi:hypothetical protein